MVTIIHLSEGSTQPAVYMIRIQLGGPSPSSSKWGDQPQVRLGQVAGEAGTRRAPMLGGQPRHQSRLGSPSRVAQSGPVGFGQADMWGPSLGPKNVVLTIQYLLIHFDQGEGGGRVRNRYLGKFPIWLLGKYFLTHTLAGYCQNTMQFTLCPFTIKQGSYLYPTFVIQPPHLLHNHNL